MQSDREVSHFMFIESTDRKSLYTQIKALVSQAQEVAAEELQERSDRLKKLLDAEDKFYEEEFANKVKTRIDADIRERKVVLHEIMKNNLEEEQQFLEAKRIQQVMESCYEIRERLRAEDLRNVKICQEEQIVENQRRKQRNYEIEKFWNDVENKRWQMFDEAQEREQCLRQHMKEQVRHILKMQLEELKERRDQERREKEDEAKALNKELEIIRREQFEAEHQPISPIKIEYRKELLAKIAAHKAMKYAEAQANKEEHLALIRETQRLEDEERAALYQRKRNLRKATMEYIAYVRRMRALETGIEKMLNDRIDDLNRVDTCTKSNIAEMLRKKAEEAARCHAILKQQICEEAERRARWDAERRENKILENRFVHPEVTREQILAQRRKVRQDLDEQIKELKRIREEEEQKFEIKLLKAVNDPEVCSELAEQYIHEGIDYLPPHPNWRIYACPKYKYVPRQSKTEAQIEENIQNASNDKCFCPKAAQPHYQFMKSIHQCEQGSQTSLRRRPLTGKITDQPPEGANEKKNAFRSCYCPPGTRRHYELMQAQGIKLDLGAGDNN